MTPILKPHFILPALGALGLALVPLRAEEGHDHSKPDRHGAHETAKTPIPASAEALWAEIDAKAKSLATQVAAKNAEAIHGDTLALEALTTAIAAKHPTLTPDRVKRVEGQVKNVTRVLDTLHHEADEGKWDKTAPLMKQFEAALSIIRQQIAAPIAN
jgi:hypothetical protein